MRRTLIIILTVLLLPACGTDEETPESKIRLIIEQMSQAAEDRSVERIAKHIAGDYKDEHHAQKAAAVQSLLGYFYRHRHIHLLTRIELIEVRNDRANAVVDVAMAGVPIESARALPGIKADLYRFDLDFAEKENVWRLVSATWSPARIQYFSQR